MAVHTCIHTDDCALDCRSILKFYCYCFAVEFLQEFDELHVCFLDWVWAVGALCLRILVDECC